MILYKNCEKLFKDLKLETIMCSYPKKFTTLIMDGNITAEEIIFMFKELNIKTYELTNGFIIHYREDAEYVWISGEQCGETFEMGLTLFNAINKNN